MDASGIYGFAGSTKLLKPFNQAKSRQTVNVKITSDPRQRLFSWLFLNLLNWQRDEVVKEHTDV